jgi:flavin-dependent dehydrogenase
VQNHSVSAEPAIDGHASPYDAIVIGGGPGGSTIAALLAARGRSVLIVEKAAHPRFHIGESLLPLNMPLFDELGVGEEIASIGMPKYGAELVSPWHGEPVSFDFAGAVDKSFPLAYQVRRSEFDRILFENAARKGATAIQECRVCAVEFDNDGASVTLRHKDGQEQRIRARFVVDASGRDTFLANQLGGKQRNRKHASAAIFGHFANARRLPGKAEGNISLFWFDHGWFWFIPLSDGSTSIGAVCSPAYMKSRRSDPDRFFLDTIEMCAPLAERLRDATLLAPATATGNYSYAVERASGPRYIMIGDAYTFIDPVFSTGVFLAMRSAFAGADTVATCLDSPARAARALKAYDKGMRQGPKVFSWFIYRLTTPAFRNLFMQPRNEKLQEAVLSMLAGDVFRDTPVHARLTMFKGLYYLFSLASPVTAWFAWKKRRSAIREAAA